MRTDISEVIFDDAASVSITVAVPFSMTRCLLMA